ncbi:MAG TPA: dihydrodipicolinate reductase C-terminal domain-containing protein [Fluviicoccus sp.]|nr:dihydrodipicolinate reductase C-terminal domain-containing protein [Fluviicoccus sp.]
MKKIRVGLFGFGKTGRIVVGEFLKNPAMNVCWVVRRSHESQGRSLANYFGLDICKARLHAVDEITPEFFERNPVDIIIDFSGQSGIHAYACAARQGIRLVSAISSYGERELDMLDEYGRESAVLYSPNITIGVNFLMVASKVMQRIAPHADIEIVEEHFKGKKDISGTARRIAGALSLDEETHINSIRVGGVIGRHEVIFGLPNQTIRVIHESINRAAFGQGAILAAQWLADKPAGVYSMEQIITESMAGIAVDLAG